MTFDDILMQYRQAKGLTSYDALAADMGLTSEGLRQIRVGKGGIKEQTIKAIMDATGLDAPVIVGVWNAQHARDPAIRKSWERWAASVAATLALLSPATTQVVDRNMQAVDSATSIYYVKSRIVRLLARFFNPFSGLTLHFCRI